MTRHSLFAATALALVTAAPAYAQTAATGNPAPADQPADTAPVYDNDIVITAQRQSQRLQDVPIAVTAFTAEALERQQIVNPVALQQTLPNITFTKTNFTSSSFTIRGVGDLCVGVTCDSATAIHVNDMPLLGTRLFESEFFDLERVEVLRGPQGTLFGRNATSGVVNFISARPDLSGVRAAGEFEYGNYDSKRVRGMFNLPIGETFGIRVAGTYLKRDGYMRNLFDGQDYDDRDLYSVRGTLSWEPSPDTRIDLIGYYFREKDNRSRIQKQLCHRDPTGILGCLPDRLAYETPNGNSTLAAVLTSAEFFSTQAPAGPTGPLLRPLALQSLYGADAYAGIVNPQDVRTVRIDVPPTYFAEEQQYTAKIFHDFGPVSFNFTGGYMRSEVDSVTDYNLAVEAPLANNPGLAFLNAAGRTGVPFYGALNAARQTLIPNGPAGGVCQSAADPNNVGVFGGNSAGCFAQSLDFDRSRIRTRQYSAEAHIDSSFDGAFNFLLGGIYFDSESRNNDYFVNAFGLDYAAGILGAAASATTPLAGNTFLASPFYRSDSDRFRLKSFGIFGETYFEVSDKLKLTLGLRYNNDRKSIAARNITLNVLTPYGSDSITDGVNYSTTDFDPFVPGVQDFARRAVKFERLTGRAVVDYKITPDNLLYASYSRGYKSGGINPPLPPAFNVPDTFGPEQVDSFEIGSKNTFGNGAFRFNLTGFYYRYKALQLSRIVARTSVNDNVDADIYGVEAETVISPTPAFVVNANLSYLHTKVSNSKLLVNPRDPSGGRSDAVIIKDITNGSNCAVVNAAGNRAIANGFVTNVNTAINGGAFAAQGVNGGAGLRGPVAIPEMGGTTGAYSICAVLTGAAAATPAAAISVLDGVPVDIQDNKLPQAPTYKFAVGAQYTLDLGGSGWSLVPRADLNYTGNSYGSIFGNTIDRLPGYEVVNAQIQLNAPDDRFYVRGFVSNLTANDAITGMYVTDQSSGLFTNVFTIEPRRYGVAAGFKF